MPASPGHMTKLSAKYNTTTTMEIKNRTKGIQIFPSILLPY